MLAIFSHNIFTSFAPRQNQTQDLRQSDQLLNAEYFLARCSVEATMSAGKTHVKLNDLAGPVVLPRPACHTALG